MPDLGQPVLDAVLTATHIEHVGHVASSRPVGITGREGELDAVVGENCVNPVWHRCNQSHEEGRSRRSTSLPDDLDEGKFTRPVNGNVEVELALGRLHLGDVDMEIADRIGFELLLVRFVPSHIGQP